MLLFLIGIIACKPKFKDPYIQISSEYTEIHFERGMPQTQLDSIQQALKTLGIQLNYTDVKYVDGVLNKLQFDIQVGNQVGSAATRFVNLRSKPFGIIIDNRSGASRLKFGDL